MELNFILDLHFFSMLAEKSTIFDINIAPKGNVEICTHYKMLYINDLWLKHWSISSNIIRRITYYDSYYLPVKILDKTCSGFF